MEKVKFGEFKVGEFFNVDTGSLAQATTLKVGTIPRITASSDNNGVSGMYAEDDRFTYTENAVTMTFLGDSFYHKGRVSLDMKVHCLTHEKMNDNIGMYISSILSKFKPYYSYGNQLSSSKLKLLKLSLPMIDSETPDWEYMDKYVKDVKARRLKIIEDFVDNELTEIIEMKVLEDVEFGEFEVSELMLITNGKGLTSQEIANHEGDIPVIQGGADGGILGFIKEQYLIDKDLVMDKEEYKISLARVGSSGSVHLHKGATAFGDKSKCLTLLDKWSEYKSKGVYSYIVSSLSKLEPMYSYSNGVSTEKYYKHTLLLPMVDPDTPDWDFMDNYMQRIESEKKDLIRQFVENAGGGSID